MPLYIRDDTVADLARSTKEATGAKTVTEAVKVALEKALAEAKAGGSSREPFAQSLAMADAMGPSDPNFDFKKFREELWGE